MIRAIPGWVMIGGGALAFVAGIVNVVGFLSAQHQAVTHVTGTVSLLGIGLAGGDSAQSTHLLLALASFVLGATISGLIIQDSTLRLGRRYSVVLLLEAALLFAAIVFFERGLEAGLYFTGIAIGMQNAMATTYSGAVIRTSHITGMFTDLGVFLGHALRGVAVEPRRLQVCLLIISGFFVGGLVGALGFARWSFEVLILPAAINIAAAITFLVYRARQHNRIS